MVLLHFSEGLQFQPSRSQRQCFMVAMYCRNISSSVGNDVCKFFRCFSEHNNFVVVVVGFLPIWTLYFNNNIFQWTHCQIDGVDVNAFFPLLFTHHCVLCCAVVSIAHSIFSRLERNSFSSSDWTGKCVLWLKLWIINNADKYTHLPLYFVLSSGKWYNFQGKVTKHFINFEYEWDHLLPSHFKC